MKQHSDNVLMIGLRASSEGIKALKELFSKLPTDNDMSYVIIVHTSDVSESSLDDLVHKITKLPVAHVHDTTRLEPNHVYILPPGKYMEMQDGAIRLTEPDTADGQRLAAQQLAELLLSGVELETKEERRQRLWLCSIVDSDVDAMVCFSPGGIILNWNKVAENVFGHVAIDAVGQPVTILAPQMSEQHKIFTDLIKTGKIKAGHSESVGLHKDGRQIEISMTLLSVKSEDNEPIGTTAVIVDITERKLAEEELKEKNKELEHFAYVMSHDLLEPINTISGLASLIDVKTQPQEEVVEELGLISSSASRLSLMINDLLQHSRIGHDSKVTKVDISKVIQEVLFDLNSTIETHDAEVEVGPLPELNAHATEIRLLFQNLISNAVKYHRKQVPPKVKISASEEMKHWHFVVEDNGLGIDQKYQDQIFIIFQRLHQAKEIAGSGIGLAHCKKIVELHHGRIWLESEPGIGSKFHFTIPKNL